MWHYQILQGEDGEFGIYEVYPDLKACTQVPIVIKGETREEVIQMLWNIIDDAYNYPIGQYAEF